MLHCRCASLIRWLFAVATVHFASVSQAADPVGMGVDRDSVANWTESGLQPHGNWTYGSYADATSWSSFMPLIVYSSYASWIGGTGYRWGVEPAIGQFSALPSSSEWAVRRWTSPTAGTIEIDYDVMRLDDVVGDNGQVAGVYQNGNQLWSQDLGSDPDGRQFSGTLATSVQAGDVVDFIVDSKGDNAGDWTHFWARIRTRHLRPSPALGLVAHWSLDGLAEMPAGASHSRLDQAADRSGNHHRSHVQSMVADDWITGRMGNMLDFDGGNDHAMSEATDIGDGAQELTVSSWISPDVQGSWRGIVTTRNSTDNSQYFGTTSTGYGLNAIEFRALNNRIESLTNSIPFSVWTHVVGVWKSGEILKLYLNGLEAPLKETPTSPPTGSIDIDHWYIGTDRLIGSRYFNGRIDDVSLWTRALSEAEILELYQLGINGWDASYLGNTPTGSWTLLMPYARGLKVWLDAQDVDGVGNTSLSDADEVLQWVNKAGGIAGNATSGNGATQTGVYRQGIGPNGTDVLQMGGGAFDSLQLDEFMVSDTFSIFVVARNSGGESSRPLFWDYDDSAGGSAVVFGTTASGAWVRDGDNDIIMVPFGGQLCDQQWDTVLMILSESGGQYALEAGSADATATAVNSQYDAAAWDGTYAAPHLGKIGDMTTTDTFEGEIAEILIYDHALAAADRDRVLDYLNRKYFRHQGGTLIRIR